MTTKRKKPTKKPIAEPRLRVKDYVGWLWSHKIQIVNLGLFSMLAIQLPGQNLFQTMTLNPQPAVAGIQKIEAPSYPPVPINSGVETELLLNAKAAIAIDPESAAILYEKNIHSPLLPASTTKIMTAMVALNHYDLDEVVTVRLAHQAIGHTVGLQAGEQLTARSLLKALLISSGNDAALALAEHYPAGYEEFIEEMNRTAKVTHMQNTHYTNVSGVESPNHYSSVWDISLLTTELLKNEFFKGVVNTRAATILDVSGKIAHQLQNTNVLLGKVTGLRGVKTGWTENSGECLITYTVRDNHPVITVVLGSYDRFGESTRLIEWVYERYRWVDVGEILDSL